MKKYKVLKWLVLFNAIFVVLSFFLPLVWLNSIEEIGLGFNFIIGINIPKPSNPLYYDSYNAYINSARLYEWLMRISFVIAIAALVLAILPFIKKDENGLNKQGKMHKTLLISVALSLVSALLIFSMLPISFSMRGVVSPEGFYAYEPIITIIVTIFIAVLLVNSKAEIATARTAPVTEKTQDVLPNSNESSFVTSENTSVVRSQTTVHSESKKIQKNYVEDKPMTKKDAEGLLAYIWVKQYNTLPFDEALDKIMAYMLEQKYVITPEMEAELTKTVGTVENVSTDMPAANNKDLRHAREAREAKNWEEAKKYYERVRDEYPDFVEAKFYYQYCKLLDTKYEDFLTVYQRDFVKIMSPLVKSVPQSDMSVDEQKELALAMIRDLGNLPAVGRKADYGRTTSTRILMDKYMPAVVAICDLGLAFEEAYAGDTELLKSTALVAFKAAFDKTLKAKAYKEYIDKYVACIQRYEPNFPYPKLSATVLFV